MSLLRGAHLAAYLLGAPGAAGTAAHLLTSKYINLMNFDGNFFLVKAITNLYDSGIPEIPESIKNAVEKIVESKEKKRAKRQAAQPQEQQHNEVFKDKKYWCRYFDYSRGAQNVIMEYDPNCVLFNIFDIKGQSTLAIAKQVSQETNTTSPENTSSSGGKVYDISSINKKEKTIDSLKLNENKDFLKGGFYLLSLDKSKFSRLNTLTHIELTEVGNERMAEQTYQKKIATLKIKAPLKGDIKDLKLNFMDDQLPSSMMLLKKVKKVENSQVSAGGSDQGGSTNKTYFLKKAEETGLTTVSSPAESDTDKKLQVLGMWEFPPTKQNKDKLSDLDLRYLDKVLWDEIGKESSKTPFSKAGLIGDLIHSLINKLTSNGGEQNEKYDNYYVVKTLSDFWNYKVGDKVNLIETTENQVGAVAKASLSLASAQTVSTGSTTDKSLAEFEIVSGLLVHLNSPIQCVPNSSSSYGEIANLAVKRNFAKTPNAVFTEKKNPFYCKPRQSGMPPYTMIFLGKNIEELNGNSAK